MKVQEETDIVIAAQLRELCIKRLPNLKNIWSGDPCGILSFHNMMNILVWHCPNLKNLFPFSIAQSLPQLEWLCIDDCGRLEEIVAKEERVEETLKFTFPQLKSLLLEGSNELKCFFPEKHTLECIQLDELRVNGSNKLKLFISKSGDLQTTVADMKQKSQMKSPVMQLLFSFAELQLMSIDGARKLDMSHSIQNLTTLTVTSCGNLTSLLSSSMVKIVPHLKRLVVQDCKKMEEVVVRDGLEAEKTLLLRELQFLKLKDLPKLTRFCACDLIACPSLNELQIYKCPVMMTFVSSSASNNVVASHELEILNHSLFNEKVVFPNLERIQIFNVNTLKKIWHNQLHLGSFYKLQVMKVLHCNQLAEIFPSNIFRRLECLKDVLIGHCDSLEVVFNNLSHQGPIIILKRSGASELRNLNIQNLPNLKHVWNQDPQHVLSFPSISSVRVSKCPSLKILFPASVARNLLQLEAIYLDDRGLGELVAEKEGAETNPMFAFPRLKSLCFLNLKELRCFYFGKHALFCPVLEKLVVYACGRLKVFAFKPVDNDLQETQMEYPLFSFKEIVSNLEDLSLTDKDAKMIQQSQLPANLFHKLKVVQIVSYHHESALLPFDLLGRFQNMEELRVHYCQFKELFPLVGNENYVKTMRLIRRLKLYNLAKLQHIWNQDSQLDKDFQSLESLNVRDCNSLIALAPSSASFPNLTTVDIESCKVLAILMTPSTAKSLVQLTKLSINKCNNLTEIVATEGIDGLKEKIIFNKLETLELLYLPSLVSFCSGEHSFRFPCLTQVIVQECPKMQFFSNGVLSTPKLQSLLVAKEDDEGRWSGNLNSTIKELSTEMARREKKLEMRWVVPLNPCLINPNLLTTRHNNSQINVEVSIGLKGIGDI